jgi:adenylosuccinate lyase
MDDAREPDRSEGVYTSPLTGRYAGVRMQRLFGAAHRACVWRRLWLALAESQRALGLPITTEALEALRARLGDADLDRVREHERRLRHDVMAHVHHLGEQCPDARGVIHLGATSCFVTDNADLVIIRDALGLVRAGMLRLMRGLADLAMRERFTPCLAFTHLQPAQPTTVGKRAALWLQDVVDAYAEVARLQAELPFRGAKGTTGTQASFLALFDGDHAKVEELDRQVARRLDFSRVLPLAGQTYPRVLDHRVLSVLAGVVAGISKFAVDVRLLQHMGEVEEPFGRGQVGSSAMAHKRNPMLCERVTALARFVLQLAGNASHTAATQWLERTLDDSANRRLTLPEAFLATDAIVRFAAVVAEGLAVYPRVMAENLARELPYLALEPIIMAGVRAGGDRQALHEALRQHAMASRQKQRTEGGPPDLLDRIAGDPMFAGVAGDLPGLLEPSRHVGRAPQQVESYLAEHVEPLLARDGDLAEAATDELPA